MKIYRIDTNGQSDWIASNSIISALRYYESVTDMGLFDFDDGDDIVEIPQQEWKNHNILNTEEYLGDEVSHPVLMTFAEWMEDENNYNSEIIATTAY